MYFTMSQIQYIGIAIVGGLILIAVLAISLWGRRLNLAMREQDEPQPEADESGEEFADGLREGHRPIPLVIMILIPLLIIWGLGYTLAYVFGVFYAQ